MDILSDQIENKASINKRRKYIIYFYVLITSVIFISVVLGFTLTFNKILVENIKNRLEANVFTLKQSIELQNVDNNTFDFQYSNLNQDVSKLPNISIQTKNIKDVTIPAYTRAIMMNGDILVSSDVFDSFEIDYKDVGFVKFTEESSCYYIYTSIENTSQYGDVSIQAAINCPISSKDQTELIKLGGIITLVIIILLYLSGIIFAKNLTYSLEDLVDKSNKLLQLTYHEILTPISVALSTAQSYLKLSDYKEGLNSVVIDLKSVIDIFSKFSRSESGEEEQKRRIKDLIEEVVITHKNKHNRIKLVNRISKHEYVKEMSFKIIMNNFLSNAIKYSKPNSDIKIYVEKRSVIVSNMIINPDSINLELIFKRGYRGENTDKVFGKGLGLAIAQEIAQENGWSVDVKIVENIFYAKLILN